MECPICDHPESNALELLRRVVDHELLVSLTRDLASRVVGLAQDPAQAARWLEIARTGDALAMRAALGEAWQAEAVACRKQEIGTREARMAKAARAISWAVEVAYMMRTPLRIGDSLTTRAVWAASAVVEAKGLVDNAHLEAAWQLEHIRAALCPRATATPPPAGRLRTSLLAR
jgi:hypothetical protein